ncbi:MAG: hypothetical protein K6E33_08980 [Lachnospiraceae bacterium]|nr:hypothetical protein [Lachnospiraceae bacterium]
MYLQGRPEEPNRYIEEGITEYVVAGFSVPEKIFDHYEQVTKMVYNTNGEDRDYYLFRKVR